MTKWCRCWATVRWHRRLGRCLPAWARTTGYRLIYDMELDFATRKFSFQSTARANEKERREFVCCVGSEKSSITPSRQDHIIGDPIPFFLIKNKEDKFDFLQAYSRHHFPSGKREKSSSTKHAKHTNNNNNNNNRNGRNSHTTPVKIHVHSTVCHVL